MPTVNGWNQWGKHVLLTLKTLEQAIKETDDRQRKLLAEVSALKVKAGIWGVLGGAIPVIVFTILKVLG